MSKIFPEEEASPSSFMSTVCDRCKWPVFMQTGISSIVFIRPAGKIEKVKQEVEKNSLGRKCLASLSLSFYLKFSKA